MKTFLHYLALPALCHVLLASDAMAAKKDEDKDTKDKKSERAEQPKVAKEKSDKPKAEPRVIEKPKARKDVAEPKKIKRPDAEASKKTYKPKDPAKQKPKSSNPDKTRPTDKKSEFSPKPETRPESAKKQDQKPKLDLDKRPKDKTTDKDKIAKKDKKADSSKKALALPGKRPKVETVERKKIDEKSAQLRKEEKKTDSAKIKKSTVEKKRVVRPGQNTKYVKRPDFNRKETSKQWWSNNKSVRSDTKVVNVTHINNNFQRNVNWSTRRSDWGYNPWWNRPAVRPWYRESWSGSWNSGYYRRHHHYNGWNGGYRPPGYYEDNHVASAIGWGLIGWSLGAMAYDTGYRSYYNPYPVRPVYVSERVEVNYARPITEVAVRNAPENEEAVAENTEKSEGFIAESQAAFKQRNYLVALEIADKAIAQTPGDGALHEYRALILFALGKYGEAAGVLNPVLASGPGWQWSTMIELYDAQETYTDQLQRLETYSEEKPEAADSHFLLGYHYMVCGHMDLATPQFELAHKLMPSDSVSKELAALTRSSADPENKAEAEAEPAEEETAPETEPVPLEKLTGTWVSNKGDAGTITLAFQDEGKFTWSFVKEGKTSEFSGEYSVNDDGLLVLDSDETQMVARVEVPEEREMKFVLVGGPPDDDGLAFLKN